MSRPETSRTISGLAVAVLLILAVPGWADETPENLLRFLGPGTAPAGAIEATVESWRVEADAATLDRAAGRLKIELADGTRFHARLRQLERRGPGDLVWRGHLEEKPALQVNLTLSKGYVVGLIDTPGGRYELRPTRGGQELARLDPSRFPSCGNDAEPTPRQTSIPVPSPDLVDGPWNIEVMVVYTAAARNGAGGVAAIEAQIQAMVDDANTSFMNSDMIPRFRLIHVAETDYEESGDIFEDRFQLRIDLEVNMLRERYGADLVGMIVETSDYCGVAYLLGNQDPATFENLAFQVSVRSCAVGNHTYSHEHGHNMGMQHDPVNGNPPSWAAFPFAYGHYVDGSFRTVMSYSSECTQGCGRVNHFSNSQVFYDGSPTGISNQRDNHETGNLIARYTASYRRSHLIFLDGFETGDLSAWN